MTPLISKDFTQDAYIFDRTVVIRWTPDGFTYALLPEHAQKIENFGISSAQCQKTDEANIALVQKLFIKQFRFRNDVGKLWKEEEE